MPQSGWCLRRALAVLALFTLSTGAPPASAAIDPDDLLPVDEAFVLRVEAATRERIELSWAIADGYYLYRHRMAAEPVDGGFRAAGLQLPAGKKHTDEFFGEVETYRQRVAATLTGAAADDVRQVQLRVRYQGCADAGVCYPPQARTVTVALPPPASAGVAALSARDGDRAPAGNAADAGDPGLAALGASLGGRRPAPLVAADITGGSDALPLPPEQAFAFEAIAGDGETLLLRFTPARGYYLYRDRTTLALDARTITLGTPRWPPGVAHRDAYFGDVTVYFDQVDVQIPLRRSSTDAQTVALTATFQGCQDEGICYPPMTRTVQVDLPPGNDRDTTDGAPAQALAPGLKDVVADKPSTATAASAADAVAPNAQSPSPDQTARGDIDGDAGQAEDSRLATALAGSQRWVTLLLFFAAGLGLSFTPCVYPMIPILAGLIAGHGTRLGTGRALLLSFVFVLANALVFTVAGVVAALLGANLQIAFQTPWIVVLFALLFVALSLSSFGLYELQLPQALRARLGAASDRQRGGSLAGVAAMGALSALIVGPCVAPPLAAAVLYIGQSQDPLFGGAALFLLAMGMGAPLLAFGVAAGRGMPASGPWMVAAQRLFGFVFLALAVWMLSRLLPAAATLALYGLLALAASAWALSAQRTMPGEGGRWAAHFAGLVLAVVGAAELLGALAGGRDPLQPLAGAFGRQQVRELPFRMIKSSADLDRELAAARAAGKPLLLDFYADWCVACKEMEKYTFPQPDVHAALAGFVLLKADVTANDAVDQALMERLAILGPPATLFYVDGRERRELRLFGFEQAPAFAARAQRAARPLAAQER